MSDFNICSSNLGYEMYDSLSVTNVTHHINEASFKNVATYRMCSVISGFGSISHSGEALPISAGDVVIIPPGFSASLSGEGIEIVSSTLKGREMNSYADELGFRNTVKRFGGLAAACDLWRAVKVTETSFIKNIRVKGIVLYTISEIYSSLSEAEKSVSESVAYRVKAYIDDNFTSPELSLKMIGEELSYHPNYVSKAFKSEFGMNVSRYVNVIRIRHSRFLIDSGEHSVKRLAELSGFLDEEYFSAVFKKQVGETPREYIKRNQNYGSVM